PDGGGGLHPLDAATLLVDGDEEGGVRRRGLVDRSAEAGELIDVRDVPGEQDGRPRPTGREPCPERGGDFQAVEPHPQELPDLAVPVLPGGHRGIVSRPWKCRPKSAII